MSDERTEPGPEPKRWKDFDPNERYTQQVSFEWVAWAEVMMNRLEGETAMATGLLRRVLRQCSFHELPVGEKLKTLIERLVGAPADAAPNVVDAELNTPSEEIEALNAQLATTRAERDVAFRERDAYYTALGRIDGTKTAPAPSPAEAQLKEVLEILTAAIERGNELANVSSPRLDEAQAWRKFASSAAAKNPVDSTTIRDHERYGAAEAGLTLWRAERAERLLRDARLELRDGADRIDYLERVRDEALARLSMLATFVTGPVATEMAGWVKAKSKEDSGEVPF